MLSYRVLLPDRATAYTFFCDRSGKYRIYARVAGPHAAAGIVADRRELYARAGTHAAVAAGSDPPAGLRVAAGTPQAPQARQGSQLAARDSRILVFYFIR